MEDVQATTPNGTHKNSLRYAYDKLPTGSTVVAAKDGLVVAACGYYKEGGMDPLLKRVAIL